MGNLLQDFSELLCEMEDWALHSASFNLCQLFMPLLEKYNEIILCSKSSIQFHVHNEKYSFLDILHNRTLGIKYAVYINGLIWKEVLMRTDKDIYSLGKEKALLQL